MVQNQVEIPQMYLKVMYSKYNLEHVDFCFKFLVVLCVKLVKAKNFQILFIIVFFCRKLNYIRFGINL